jgi:uncharacterized protein YukE
MTFDMGAQTLSQLTTATSSASDDLGSNVRALYDAAAPLESKFNGEGRAAFDRFKADTDDIATQLNSALAAVLGGIDGQNTAFLDGEQQMAEETGAAYSGSAFDAARFSSPGR